MSERFETPLGKDELLKSPAKNQEVEIHIELKSSDITGRSFPGSQLKGVIRHTLEVMKDHHIDVLLYAARKQHRSQRLLVQMLLHFASSFDQTTRRSTPPKGLLIDLFMPPDSAEEAIYNILGRYDYWAGKHGWFWARVIFMSQSMGAILSFWTDWLLRRSKLLEILRKS